MALTEKGRWRDRSVATRDHDADPGFHERDGEIDDLRTLLIDRQRSDGHDGFLIDHLEVTGRTNLDEDSSMGAGYIVY